MNDKYYYKYLKYKNKYLSHKGGAIMYKINYNDDIKTLETKLKTLETEVNKKIADIHKLRKELKHNDDINKLDTEVKKKTSEIDELRKQIIIEKTQNYTNNLSLLKKKIEEILLSNKKKFDNFECGTDDGSERIEKCKEIVLTITGTLDRQVRQLSNVFYKSITDMQTIEPEIDNDLANFLILYKYGRILYTFNTDIFFISQSKSQSNLINAYENFQIDIDDSCNDMFRKDFENLMILI